MTPLKRRHNFEGCIQVGDDDDCPETHRFAFHSYIDDNHTGLKTLGWTPPGLEDFLNNELMGERGDCTNCQWSFQ